MPSVNPGPASSTQPNAIPALFGAQGTSLGTLASLPAGMYAGQTAYTSDSGLVVWSGTAWAAQTPPAPTAEQIFTTGASGTATAGIFDLSVILDGVGTTFALTFPVAFLDKQIVRVLSATAVSVAFSITGSGDGSTIKTVPATTAAGSGVAWIYRLANTTWYRRY